MWQIAAFALISWVSFQKCLSFLRRRKYIRLYKCQSSPALPQMDPVFGLDLVLNFFRSGKQNRRLKAIEENHGIYGTTYSSRVLGRTAFQTIDVRNIQAVFAIDAASYEIGHTRGAAMEPLIGMGILCAEEQTWKQLRALYQQAFSRIHISNNLLSFDRHVETFLQVLPSDNSPVNLGPLFANLNLDTATEFIFGESIDLQVSKSRDSEAFLRAFDVGKLGVAARFLLGNLRFLYRSRAFIDSCKFVNDWAQSRVDDIHSNISAPGEPQAEPQGSYPKQYILGQELAMLIPDRSKLRQELLNAFFAGHDNPGIAMTSIFFNLARHPEAWAKLRREVLEKGDSEVDFELLKSLKYTSWVINESFRLHPVVPQNTRICAKATHLPCGGGPSGEHPVYIHPGDRVAVNFWSLYRSKEYFGEDVELFRPERWETLRPSWEFIPFSGGPRTCPAQQLSRIWIGHVLVKMAREFKEIVNQDPVWEFVEETKLSLESKNGALVSLIRA